MDTIQNNGGCQTGQARPINVLFEAWQLEDLARSRISIETAILAGVHSESNPIHIQAGLRWERSAESLGTCLVFPYLDVGGNVNGYAVYKPRNPRTIAGKVVKYESPLGLSPRAYFSPWFRKVLDDRSRPIPITEGQKKTLSADEAGFPGIGISGPWGWTKKRTEDQKKIDAPRELIDDLAGIDWKERNVVLIFDTDPRSNSNVNQGVSELGQVLADRGAKVFRLSLPKGPRDQGGTPGKMGLDDYIFAYGPEAFADLLRDQTAIPVVLTLDEYRAAMVRARIYSVGKPGVFMDRGPTGAGKTHSIIPALRSVKKSLHVSPSHKQCQEVVTMLQTAGFDAAKYPSLTDGKGAADGDDGLPTCKNFEMAKRAMDCGLSPSSAVCPECQHQNECEYKSQMAEAEAAAHAVACHQRAVYSLKSLADGRESIVVNEDPSDLLRPAIAAKNGFLTVANIAHLSREYLAIDSDKSIFLSFMEDAARSIHDRLHGGNDFKTQAIDPPPAVRLPRNIDIGLFDTIQHHDIEVDPDALRLCRAIAAGQIDQLVLRVDTSLQKGGTPVIHRSVVGIQRNPLPAGTTTWVNDATLSPEECAMLVGQEVHDMTPGGSLKDLRSAFQVVGKHEITQRTTPGTVLKILRGVLAMCPEAQRVGVICHQRHAPAIKGTSKTGPNLEQMFRDRIAKVSYYREGITRGSNAWIEECDMLVCLGTPRVPPTVIKDHLIRLGLVQAAGMPDAWTEWSKDYWLGITETGRRVVVRCLNYRDWDWRAAYRSRVLSELIQAVGRGRSKCETGIPVIVVANDDIGLTLVDKPPIDIPEEAVKVLEVMADQTRANAKGERDQMEAFPKGVEDPREMEVNAKIYYLGNASISTTSTTRIAKAINRTRRHADQLLKLLLDAGLVRRTDKRGYWQLIGPPTPLSPSGPGGRRRYVRWRLGVGGGWGGLIETEGVPA